MNEDYYVIFSVDDGQKLIFIEKHLEDDTIIKTGTFEEMEEYAKAQGYEVVDISSWEFESFEDKCIQVRNYRKSVNRRKLI